VLTKALPSTQFHQLLSKLGSTNPLDPAWGGVLKILKRFWRSLLLCHYQV
jgi:hypothetical protein